jgi:sugar lactone lactonase YvrE
MLNPFKQPELIKAETFMSMPAKFRARARTKWSDHNRQRAEVDSFLEGPSFDRAGHLYFVDIPFGRIFPITRKGEWELVTQYDARYTFSSASARLDEERVAAVGSLIVRGALSRRLAGMRGVHRSGRTSR